MTVSDAARHELEELGAWFRSLLEADSSPVSQKAVFWHEVVHPEDGPYEEPVTRGPTFLEYYDGVRVMGPVPGQFGLDRALMPEPRARRILWSTGGGPGSVMRVAFHYEMAGGAWAGKICTESYEEFSRLAIARREVLERLAEEFARLWTPETVDMGLQYGIPASRPEAGPHWRVALEKPDGTLENGFHPVPSSLVETHGLLMRTLSDHGREHLLSYVFSTEVASGDIGRAIILYY